MAAVCRKPVISAVFEDCSLIAGGACSKPVWANFKLAKPGVESQKAANFGRQLTARDYKVSRKAQKWLRTYDCWYMSHMADGHDLRLLPCMLSPQPPGRMDACCISTAAAMSRLLPLVCQPARYSSHGHMRMTRLVPPFDAGGRQGKLHGKPWPGQMALLIRKAGMTGQAKVTEADHYPDQLFCCMFNASYSRRLLSPQDILRCHYRQQWPAGYWHSS